jgi:ribosomal protein L32
LRPRALGMRVTLAGALSTRCFYTKAPAVRRRRRSRLRSATPQAWRDPACGALCVAGASCAHFMMRR